MLLLLLLLPLLFPTVAAAVAFAAAAKDLSWHNTHSCPTHEVEATSRPTLFYNFRAVKTVDWQTLCVSVMSIEALKWRKGRSGRLKRRNAIHYTVVSVHTHTSSIILDLEPAVWAASFKVGLNEEEEEKVYAVRSNSLSISVSPSFYLSECVWTRGLRVLFRVSFWIRQIECIF